MHIPIEINRVYYLPLDAYYPVDASTLSKLDHIKFFIRFIFNYMKFYAYKKQATARLVSLYDLWLNKGDLAYTFYSPNFFPNLQDPYKMKTDAETIEYLKKHKFPPVLKNLKNQILFKDTSYLWLVAARNFQDVSGNLQIINLFRCLLLDKVKRGDYDFTKKMEVVFGEQEDITRILGKSQKRNRISVYNVPR